VCVKEEKRGGMTTRIFEVHTGSFTARSEWVKLDSIWACRGAGPKIGWVKGLSPREVETRLRRMGARWEWKELCKN